MRWFDSADFNIQSNKVFLFVHVISTIVSGVVVVIDYAVDLNAGPLEAFSVYFGINLITLIINLKYNPQWVRYFLPLSLFGIIEYLFLIQPQIFNTIIYWLPFVPILAILIMGLRASQVWFIVVLTTHLFNYYYVGKHLGTSYSLQVSKDPFFVSGIVFQAGILTAIYLLYNLISNVTKATYEKNQELTNLKDSIEQKGLRLTAFNAALIELTRNPEGHKDTSTLFENVCALAQDSLEVNRVSVWLLNANRDAIELKALFEDGKDKTEPIILTKTEFPAYFSALETKPFIMAHDAKEHEDTSEFKESYLSPLGIQSMLDCPILLDQTAIGVVCCEHIDSRRKWEAEDALITQSLADFIATHFKNEQIRNLLSTLKTQNKELSLNGSMIESMNQELHQLNQKLVESNGSLEAAVNERTKELVTQNNQLKEYAFVNSHMLRAPLSSILGISNLLLMQSTSITDKELLNGLHQSTKNLDEIVRRISTALEDGSNLSRKDIDYIINEQFKNSKL